MSLIGTGIDIWQGLSDRDKARAARRDLLSGVVDMRDIYGEGYDAQQALYEPYKDIGDEYLQKMLDYEQSLDPDLYKLPEMGEFAYDKDVSAFLDPSMKYQMDQATRQLQSSAAARGGLLSGKTGMDIMSRGTELARQDYGNAYERMMGDKRFAYQDYINRFNAARANVQDRYAKNVDRYKRYGGIADLGTMATGQLANITGSRAGTMADLRGQEAAISAQGRQDPTNMDFFRQGLKGVIDTGAQAAGMMAGMGMGVPTPAPAAPLATGVNTMPSAMPSATMTPGGDLLGGYGQAYPNTHQYNPYDPANHFDLVAQQYGGGLK